MAKVKRRRVLGTGLAARGNCLGSRSRMKRGFLIMKGGKLTVVVVVVVTMVVFVAGAVDMRHRPSWMGVTGRLGAVGIEAGDADSRAGVDLEGCWVSGGVSRRGVCVERSRPFVVPAARSNGPSGEASGSMARGRVERGGLSGREIWGGEEERRRGPGRGGIKKKKGRESEKAEAGGQIPRKSRPVVVEQQEARAKTCMTEINNRRPGVMSVERNYMS